MSNRNLILDIYKGMLILLVVVGHFLLKWCVGKDTDYRLINGIISVIYSFHMSAFFAASGYSFEKYRGGVKAIVLQSMQNGTSFRCLFPIQYFPFFMED